MRRTLVLGNEAARHPFRRSLPVSVTLEAGAHPLLQHWARIRPLRQPMAPSRITMQDLRDFFLAYCACFLAVSAFIW